MSFSTYTGKNLVKTVQDTSFYDYLTGSIVDSNNKKIKSAKQSANTHSMKANIPSLYNRNNDPNFVENEKNKAEAANQYALDLERQNGEIAGFTNSQFSDDFVESPRLQLEIPNYSVENYIEERAKWTKGITSIADEPGWFYFKIFFKFNTNYGLFGGVLRDTNAAAYFPSNCALKYLWAIDKYYTSDNIEDRIVALYKFTDMLSDICTNSPWLFKGVNGLSDAMKIRQNDFSKDQKIEILFNDERTDMRIGSLLNLYKFLCYDDINCKEVLPENLRKFDMCISLFHVPIKYFQTGIMVSNKKNLSTGLFSGKLAKIESIIEKTVNFLTTKAKYFKYKTMYPENGNFSNMFSFKLFTFSNCEIDIDSISKYLEGSQIDNSTAFNIGKGMSLAIKYDRVYYSEMNEWNQFMFGSMGFEYNAYNEEFKERFIKFPDDFGLRRIQPKNYWLDRLSSLKEAKEDAQFYDKNAEQYKALIDYSESIITDGLMSMDMEDYYSFIKGNIYGGSALIYSPYWRAKMGALKYGSLKGNIYGDDLSPKYGVNGSGQIGLENGYFKAKISALKNGSIEGNLYEKDLLDYQYVYDEATKEMVMVDGYFKEKINRLKGTKNIGNLYDKELGPNITKNSSGQIGIEEHGYFYEKLKMLKKGKITGNLYDRIYGVVVHNFNGEGAQENSEYLNEKIRALKGNSASSGKPTKSSLGNLFGDEISMIGNFDDRTKSEYLSKKVNMIKDGTIEKASLYGDLTLTGPMDDRQKTKFYKEKLDHFKKAKNLGNIHYSDQTPDLSTFISKSSQVKKPILNNSEYIESLEGDLELRNALNLSNTGMVGPQLRNIEINEDLAPENQFNEKLNNGFEIRNNLASLYYASPTIDRNYTSEHAFNLEQMQKAADDSFKRDGSTSKINSLKAQTAHRSLEINQVSKVKREIWNYQLTGKPKGAAGGILDAFGDIASFWQGVDEIAGFADDVKTFIKSEKPFESTFKSAVAEGGLNGAKDLISEGEGFFGQF